LTAPTCLGRTADEEVTTMVTTQPAIRTQWLICRRCRRVWSTTCEVREFRDDEGDHELFSIDGEPVPPPWTQACPTCGGLRVERLPGPLTRR
jgi:hypothetical protein